MPNLSLKIEQAFNFTKSTLEQGENGKIVSEGEWFTIGLKILFEEGVISRVHGYDLENLLGFKLTSHDKRNVYSNVRIRLGYFSTLLSQILHRAVTQMKLNELAHISFEIDPLILDESFTKIKANQKNMTETVNLDLKFEVYLGNIEKDTSSRPIYELTECDLYDLCNEHKTDASELFKCGNVLTAFKRYSKSMSYLLIAMQTVKDKLEQIEQYEQMKNVAAEDLECKLDLLDIREKLRQTKCQLYSNLSLCQMKSGALEQTILNCGKALEISPANVKALFRRGQAYIGVREYEKAIQDLKTALTFDPDLKEARQSLNHAETLKKIYEQEMSSRFKKLFSE